jgi:hypothetical protein
MGLRWRLMERVRPNDPSDSDPADGCPTAHRFQVTGTEAGTADEFDLHPYIYGSGAFEFTPSAQKSDTIGSEIVDVAAGPHF